MWQALEDANVILHRAVVAQGVGGGEHASGEHEPPAGDDVRRALTRGQDPLCVVAGRRSGGHKPDHDGKGRHLQLIATRFVRDHVLLMVKLRRSFMFEPEVNGIGRLAAGGPSSRVRGGVGEGVRGHDERLEGVAVAGIAGRPVGRPCEVLAQGWSGVLRCRRPRGGRARRDADEGRARPPVSPATRAPRVDRAPLPTSARVPDRGQRIRGGGRPAGGAAVLAARRDEGLMGGLRVSDGGAPRGAGGDAGTRRLPDRAKDPSWGLRIRGGGARGKVDGSRPLPSRATVRGCGLRIRGGGEAEAGRSLARKVACAGEGSAEGGGPGVAPGAPQAAGRQGRGASWFVCARRIVAGGPQRHGGSLERSPAAAQGRNGGGRMLRAQIRRARTSGRHSSRRRALTRPLMSLRRCSKRGARCRPLASRMSATSRRRTIWQRTNAEATAPMDVPLPHASHVCAPHL